MFEYENNPGVFDERERELEADPFAEQGNLRDRVVPERPPHVLQSARGH